MKKQDFITAFNSIEKMKLFEIEVTDKRTNEKDYIIFDIAIIGRSFIAQHITLTAKQEKSKKISFIKLPFDLSHSIDENLQELLCYCEQAIIDSDFYTLNY